MWQNLIAVLSRNPAALKALADLIAPSLRNLLRQESSEEFLQLRREVETLSVLVNRDVPLALTRLSAGQGELAQSVEQLRQEVRQSGQQQSEGELALRAQVARLEKELATTREALRQAQAAGTLPAPRRRWPW